VARSFTLPKSAERHEHFNSYSHGSQNYSGQKYCEIYEKIVNMTAKLYLLLNQSLSRWWTSSKTYLGKAGWSRKSCWL